MKSYCTYVGIQYWENRAYVKKGTTGGIEIWGRQQKNQYTFN